MAVLFTTVYLFAIFYIANNEEPFQITDWLFTISIVALIAEMMRLVPQCILNYEANVFIGIDLGTILLDIVGGIASVLQIILDSRDMYGDDGIIDGIKGMINLPNFV